MWAAPILAAAPPLQELFTVVGTLLHRGVLQADEPAGPAVVELAVRQVGLPGGLVVGHYRPHVALDGDPVAWVEVDVADRTLLVDIGAASRAEQPLRTVPCQLYEPSPVHTAEEWRAELDQRRLAALSVEVLSLT